MRISRLGWSGLEIESGGDTLLIDYILDTSELPLRDGRQPFPSATAPGGAVAALLTHLHADHADPVALAAALRDGAPVFRPEPAKNGTGFSELTAHAETAFGAVSLDVRVSAPWSSHRAGAFAVHAVPAVDGFGDPQVSWVVEADGRRILHAGDTLLHGHWWRIAHEHGPFDHVFLPINGPLVDFPFLQPPRGREAVMTPEEAVSAARMLGGSTMTPIHYGALHRPPNYVETHDAVRRLRVAAAGAEIEVRVIEPGEDVEV